MRCISRMRRRWRYLNLNPGSRPPRRRRLKWWRNWLHERRNLKNWSRFWRMLRTHNLSCCNWRRIQHSTPSRLFLTPTSRSSTMRATRNRNCKRNQNRRVGIRNLNNFLIQRSSRWPTFITTLNLRCSSSYCYNKSLNPSSQKLKPPAPNQDHSTSSCFKYCTSSSGATLSSYPK